MEKNINFYYFNIDDESLNDEICDPYKHLITGDFKFLADQALDSFLEASPEKLANESEVETLRSLGAAALLAFVKGNFTGPDSDSSEATNNEDVSRKLSVDSEEINVNVKSCHLLLVAKNVWSSLVLNLPDQLVHHLWYLRYLIIHQKVLEEQCITLYEQFKATSKIIQENLHQIHNKKDCFLVQLEIIQGYLLYKRVFEAEKLLKEVIESMGLDLEVTGELGVRTKFQTKALPQLTLKIDRKENDLDFKTAEITHKSTNLPKLLTLDDDVRLEKIKFNSNDVNETESLESVIQNLLLTYIKFLKLSQPKDILSDEELRPYITSLLYQDYGPLMVRIETLLININLESTHRRTVERSLKQCEDLVNLLNSTDIPIQHRLSYVFSSSMRPKWEIELQLGELMISLGMIKTALDLYLRLSSWEDVILCYTALQLRHKAAEIIKQELDKNPTVKLYCLLGDATDDISCYETAWNFSNQKSGRAQRHWGNHYFAKKEYEEAIPHLQKSVEINSLQEAVWLRLGYAALQVENWELAANAYRRYTQLEQHGFESWNNLAKAYIKMGDKKRAHKVLQEALKCNFNNWMVWENLLLVSVDIGSFEDAINAYNRLIELKEKYYDEEILRILVRAISKDIPDINGIGSKRLTKKCLALLGQQSSQNPINGVLWELSAMITDDVLQKAQKLQKAHRGYTQSQTNWVKEIKSCEKVIDLCMQLCESSIEASKSIKEGERIIVVSQLSSARLSAMGCVKVAKAENYDSLNEKLTDLDNRLDEIVVLIKGLQ